MHQRVMKSSESNNNCINCALKHKISYLGRTRFSQISSVDKHGVNDSGIISELLNAILDKVILLSRNDSADLSYSIHDNTIELQNDFDESCSRTTDDMTVLTCASEPKLSTDPTTSQSGSFQNRHGSIQDQCQRDRYMAKILPSYDDDDTSSHEIGVASALQSSICGAVAENSLSGPCTINELKPNTLSDDHRSTVTNIADYSENINLGTPVERIPSKQSLTDTHDLFSSYLNSVASSSAIVATKTDNLVCGLPFMSSPSAQCTRDAQESSVNCDPISSKSTGMATVSESQVDGEVGENTSSEKDMTGMEAEYSPVNCQISPNHDNQRDNSSLDSHDDSVTICPASTSHCNGTTESIDHVRDCDTVQTRSLPKPRSKRKSNPSKCSDFTSKTLFLSQRFKKTQNRNFILKNREIIKEWPGTKSSTFLSPLATNIENQTRKDSNFDVSEVHQNSSGQHSGKVGNSNVMNSANSPALEMSDFKHKVLGTETEDNQTLSRRPLQIASYCKGDTVDGLDPQLKSASASLPKPQVKPSETVTIGTGVRGQGKIAFNNQSQVNSGNFNQSQDDSVSSSQSQCQSSSSENNLHLPNSRDSECNKQQTSSQPASEMASDVSMVPHVDSSVNMSGDVVVMNSTASNLLLNRSPCDAQQSLSTSDSTSKETALKKSLDRPVMNATCGASGVSTDTISHVDSADSDVSLHVERSALKMPLNSALKASTDSLASDVLSDDSGSRRSSNNTWLSSTNKLAITKKSFKSSLEKTHDAVILKLMSVASALNGSANTSGLSEDMLSNDYVEKLMIKTFPTAHDASVSGDFRSDKPMDDSYSKTVSDATSSEISKTLTSTIALDAPSSNVASLKVTSKSSSSDITDDASTTHLLRSTSHSSGTNDASNTSGFIHAISALSDNSVSSVRTESVPENRLSSTVGSNLSSAISVRNEIDDEVSGSKTTAQDSSKTPNLNLNSDPPMKAEGSPGPLDSNFDPPIKGQGSSGTSGSSSDPPINQGSSQPLGSNSDPLINAQSSSDSNSNPPVKAQVLSRPPGSNPDPPIKTQSSSEVSPIRTADSSSSRRFKRKDGSEIDSKAQTSSNRRYSLRKKTSPLYTDFAIYTHSRSFYNRRKSNELDSHKKTSKRKISRVKGTISKENMNSSSSAIYQNTQKSIKRTRGSENETAGADENPRSDSSVPVTSTVCLDTKLTNSISQAPTKNATSAVFVSPKLSTSAFSSRPAQMMSSSGAPVPIKAPIKKLSVSVTVLPSSCVKSSENNKDVTTGTPSISALDQSSKTVQNFTSRKRTHDTDASSNTSLNANSSKRHKIHVVRLNGQARKPLRKVHKDGEQLSLAQPNVENREGGLPEALVSVKRLVVPTDQISHISRRNIKIAPTKTVSVASIPALTMIKTQRNPKIMNNVIKLSQSKNADTQMKTAQPHDGVENNASDLKPSTNHVLSRRTNRQTKSLRSVNLPNEAPDSPLGVDSQRQTTTQPGYISSCLNFRYIPKLHDILSTVEPGVATCCFCQLPANHVLGIGDLFGPYRPLAEEVLARQSSYNKHLETPGLWDDVEPAYAADGSPTVTIDRDSGNCFITSRVQKNDLEVEKNTVEDLSRAIKKSSHHLRSLTTIDHILQDSSCRTWRSKQKFLQDSKNRCTVRIPGPKGECNTLPDKMPSTPDPSLPDIDSIVFIEPKLNLSHSNNDVTMTSPVTSRTSPRRSRSGNSQTRSPSRDRNGGFTDSTTMSISHRFDTGPLWTHGYCAVWADGVYAIRGQLYGLWDAMRDSSKHICVLCGRPGATIVTYEDSLDARLHGSQLKAYHYPCALNQKLMLNWENLTAYRPSEPG